jgi:hypothetical protein
MSNKLLLVFFIASLLGCSGTKLIDQWKSPEKETFEASKVLVIGISPNIVARKTFEDKLANALEKKGVNAVRSTDFFEQSFGTVEKSEKELGEIEKQLFDAGFDAVLFSTVTGSENKVSTVQSFKNLSQTLDSFRDYYYSNQHIYYEDDNRETYKIFHTETALYCICPGKGRELLWKGYFDIVDPQKMKLAVSKYVKVLIRGLKEQQLLVVD